MRRRQFMTAMAAGLAAPALLSRAGLAQSGKTVVFHLKNVTNPFYKNVRDGAERAAKELGINIQIAAPTKPDNIEEQIRIVEDWVVRKPDAMVFVPVDYKAMVPSVQKVKDAKIPFVIYNNKMAEFADHTFLGLDDEEIGFLTSTNLFKAMGGKGNVIHIDGVPGAITAQDRKKGLDRALKDFPDVKLLASQPGSYRRLPAVQVFENLMQRFPQIDGVMASNDDMAVGVVEAAATAGRAQIKVAGIDCIPDALQAIKEGRMLGSVDTAAHDQGYFSMRAMAEVLAGKSVPRQIMLPLTFVDRAIVDTYMVPPLKRPAPDWDKVLRAQKSS